MTSRGVKRIGDVAQASRHQFAEDAGPMAHPIRPESYIEMNNFYTSTVYEKGAEVIRMYETLLGKGRVPEGHGPLLREARRPGGHVRRFPSRDGGRQRRRSHRVQTLVLASGYPYARRHHRVRL